MEINIGKTKEMRISKNECYINITLDGKTVEQVNSSKSLGSLVTWNTDGTRSRVSMGNRGFEKVTRLQTARKIPSNSLRKIC